MAAAGNDPVNLVARTESTGSIAARGTVQPYEIGDVYDSGLVEILETLPGGIVHGRIVVIADTLPPGGRVNLQIWAGGAQFANGTALKDLYAADFNADGIAWVDVYYPTAAAISSFCHYTRLYDANGTLLSSY